MSEKYKFLDPSGMYFVTSTIVGWADVFTRPDKTFALDLLNSAGLSGGNAFLKVLNSGTVYFNVGDAPDESINVGYTSSDTVPPMSFGSNHPGDGDIWYMASAS